MVIIIKYRFFLFGFFSFFLLISCNTYYKFGIKEGEDIPKDAPYTIIKKMNSVDSFVIDTTKLYSEVSYYVANKEFVNRKLTSLKFNGDGTLRVFSRNNELEKNINYMEFKFALTGDKLQVEGFFPSKGGKTKLYTRELSNGYVNGNTIVINWLNMINTVYLKN